VLTRSSKRKNRRLSRVVFDEKADPGVMEVAPWEEPPISSPAFLPPGTGGGASGSDSRVAYWLMRVIRTTVLTGGFVSADVYVPKCIWTQIGAKFHALGAKISALEHLMILLTTHIYPLEYPDDMHSAEETRILFSSFYRDLIVLQNNLSKPFTYIKEMPVPGQATAPNPTTQVGKLTSMFSAVGKNVIKYAEVGYSRIGSVMKARASDQEMASYVALSSELCEKCQILDGWLQFVEKEISVISSEVSKPPAESPQKNPALNLDLTSLVAHNVGNPSPRLDCVSTPSPQRSHSSSIGEEASTVKSPPTRPSPQQELRKSDSESCVGTGTPPRPPPSIVPKMDFSSVSSPSPHTNQGMSPLSSPRDASPRYDSPREGGARPASRRMSRNMHDLEKARMCADLSPGGGGEAQSGDIYRVGAASQAHAAKHVARLQVLFKLLHEFAYFSIIT
jgi:hypothetical protein